MLRPPVQAPKPRRSHADHDTSAALCVGEEHGLSPVEHDAARRQRGEERVVGECSGMVRAYVQDGELAPNVIPLAEEACPWGAPTSAMRVLVFGRQRAVAGPAVGVTGLSFKRLSLIHVVLMPTRRAISSTTDAVRIGSSKHAGRHLVSKPWLTRSKMGSSCGCIQALPGTPAQNANRSVIALSSGLPGVNGCQLACGHHGLLPSQLTRLGRYFQASNLARHLQARTGAAIGPHPLTVECLGTRVSGMSEMG